MGSYTLVELQKAGHRVVIVDDLSNAKPGVIDKIERMNKRLSINTDANHRNFIDNHYVNVFLFLFFCRSIPYIQHFFHMLPEWMYLSPKKNELSGPQH